ncbi:ribbon-helix-helix protein, CopG family [Haloarcula amylovorans]|uniref:ribbon-helix-helix protein, CopG family n=1 Tax=Haloarcula amylovorans TaxID=2562280 RepID=UPI0010768DE4|nr:ribbon-helix-helix protein, CopG family [Halomicroarcula amylolytica]
MNESFLDLDEVEIELDEAALEALDEKAFKEHRDNRDAAIRDLLDEWLKAHDSDEE